VAGGLALAGAALYVLARGDGGAPLSEVDAASRAALERVLAGADGAGAGTARREGAR
jgi:hypothetical protein